MVVRHLFMLGIVFALYTGPAAAAHHALKGVALVIGETDYIRLPQLTNPDTDARDIDHLLDDLGFDVERVLDGRSDQLHDALDRFLAHAKGADVALVYYAGHGIEAGGKDYLMGTDVDISDPESAGDTLIPLDDVMARLQKTVPISILLVDACRTDPFGPGQQLVLAEGAPPVAIGAVGLGAVRGPTPVTSGKSTSLGMTVGFSASPGQSALDGPPGGNSPYAAALLRHLGADGYSFGDIMTMVSEEVYVDTGARQTPWTDSSLSRILYFGRRARPADGDDAKILDDRRKLLLEIAAVPDQSRAYVETVASQQDLKLADLYSMLDIINAGKGAGVTDANREQLLDVAQRVRETLDDPLLPAAPTDPQLARWDALASKAIAAGDFRRAYRYRQQEAKRAAKIEKGLDQKQADIDAKRRELAGVYARVAEAAMYTLQSDAEAKAYDRAASQSKLFDPALSLRFRLRAADALVRKARGDGDYSVYPTAAAIYQDVLKTIDKSKQPRFWGQIEAKLADALRWTSTIQMDPGTIRDSVSAASAALTVVTPRSDYADWFLAQGALALGLFHQDDYDAAKLAVTALVQGVPRSRVRDWVDAESQYALFWWTLGNYRSSPQPAFFGPPSSNEVYSLGALKAYGEAADAFGRAAAAMKGVNRAIYGGSEILQAATSARVSAARHDIPALRAELAQARAGIKVVSEQGVISADKRKDFGLLLAIVGKATDDRALMKEALKYFARARKVITETQQKDAWAFIRESEGGLLSTIGNENRDKASLRAGISAYKDALEGFTELGFLSMIDRVKEEKTAAQAALAALDGKPS